MKKRSLFVLLLVYAILGKAQVMKDSIYSPSIKTILFGKEGVEMSLPIIQLGSNEKLLLRFDELSNNANYYRYRIQHCTHDWQPSDIPASDFINGFEESSIDNQQFSFTTLQPFVNYWETIPSDISTFLASGNYLLTVFLQNDPDSIIFTRRFRIYEPLSEIGINIGKPQGSTGLMENQNVSVNINPLVGNFFTNPDIYMFVYAQQNGRKDLTRLLPLESMSGNTLNYYWKPENIFPGGNEFRYFDISNLNVPMYNVWKLATFGGENIVFLKPEKNRSKDVYLFENGLNGQFKIASAYSTNVNTESDYASVNFSFPTQIPYLDGNIYILGDFTDWEMNNKSRMNWDPNINAYTARLYLKQGYYSYELVFVPFGTKIGLTSTLEGNHFQTMNDYYIYVYQRYPGDRYDRLIGFGQAQSP